MNLSIVLRVMNKEMKHVFVVHSPITYLSALGVILKEKINKEDILILSETFRLTNAPIEIICLEDKLNIIEKNFIVRKFFNFSLKKMNKCVDVFLKGNPFIAYISVFVTNNRFLIFHEKCQTFNFIEEGLASYYEYYNIKQIVANTIGRWSFSFSNLKEYLREIFWITFKEPSKINAIPTHYIAYATIPDIFFYGFTEYSFPVAKNRKNISMRDVISSFRFISDSVVDLNDGYIWIGDPDIYLEFESFDSYLQSIYDGYINFLRGKGRDSTFIKFHYREKGEYCEKILNLFKQNGIKYEVLGNVIMEVELSKCENVTLVGFHSSLLLYAKLMGHKAYSIMNYTSLKKSSIDNNQIPVFWALIDKL